MLSALAKGMEVAAVLLLLLSLSHLLSWALEEILAGVSERQVHIDRCRMGAEKEVEVLKPGCLWWVTTLPGVRHSRSLSSSGWRQAYA
jgi:hypothetical protein